MKKTILILITLVAILTSGCAKVVETKTEMVEVTVVAEYYRGAMQVPTRINGVTRYRYRPAIYQITVEYNGQEYTIDDKETYEEYCEKIGEVVLGELETKVYDNGDVRNSILSLSLE